MYKIMNIRRKKYIVVKNVLSSEMCDLAFNYLINKKTSRQVLLDTKNMNPFSKDLGLSTDGQADCYSVYGDLLMDTLLSKIKPIMEKNTGLVLNESYSYARIYQKGNELRRHKDRFSCEISSTLFLGGDEWPIFVDPNPKNGYYDIEKDKYMSPGAKGKKIDLKKGDMLIYLGQELEHWRDVFFEDTCCQVFFHYNDLTTEGAEENQYDRRLCLGLPDYMRDVKLDK